MWIEELSIENIKCFEKCTIRFGQKTNPYRWINLLGENGSGKSSVLQTLGILLSGPEGHPNLLARPEGWVRNETVPGKISIRIHQSDCDPNRFGETKERKAFGYTFYVTGDYNLSIRNKIYSEPAFVENKDKILTWLRQNALTP